MTNAIEKLKQNSSFLWFLLLFAYAQSIQNRLSIRREVDWYIFTPEAAAASVFLACLLFLIINFFTKQWQHSVNFSAKEGLKIFGVSLLVYLTLIKLVGFLIALTFDTVERNFNTQTLLLSTLSNLLDGFIYGSFYLAYQYFKRNSVHQKQIATSNRLLAESEIANLKS